MMLLIEYINVLTEGNWQSILMKKRWMQYVIGTLLGALPGCLGAFTVVSLYSHKIISIGTVVAAMIATSGDEAFVMFSLFPLKALFITGILFAVGCTVGIVVDMIVKNDYFLIEHLDQHLPLHGENQCQCFPTNKLIPQLRNITFERAILIVFFLLFLFFLITGAVGSASWDWKRITFMVGTIFSLFVVTTVPDHFLQEHLWEHVLKKHLLRIFLWTFGALLLLHFLQNYMDINTWVQGNRLIVLLIAVLVGIIPESGPHLLFVTMYMDGTVPFGILLASSIVQDGHGMLPMLAVSKRSFVWVKCINVLTGFIIGFIAITFF
jgi:hypothetical protein